MKYLTRCLILRGCGIRGPEGVDRARWATRALPIVLRQNTHVTKHATVYSIQTLQILWKLWFEISNIFPVYDSRKKILVSISYDNGWESSCPFHSFLIILGIKRKLHWNGNFHERHKSGLKKNNSSFFCWFLTGFLFKNRNLLSIPSLVSGLNSHFVYTGLLIHHLYNYFDQEL